MNLSVIVGRSVLGIVACIFLPDIILLSYVISTYFVEEDKKLNVFFGECVNFMVYPSDIDLNMHMNNSRYLRILNYTRRRFCSSAGIWKFVRLNGLNLIVQAQTIRYRKELRLFEQYSVTTKIASISDDLKDCCFYLESSFKNSSGFVCAIHYVKYKLVGNRSSSIKPSVILERIGAIKSSVPAVGLNPEGFVKLWEQANLISSKELNPDKN